MQSKSLQSFPDWQSWLHENLARNCNRNELAEILVSNHFSRASIAQEMVSWDSNKNDPIGRPEEPNSNKRFHRSATSLANPDSGHIVFKLNSETVELYLIENFLTPQECELVMSIGDRVLRPSTVTVNNGDNAFRTSSTADLGWLEYPAMAQIDEKICGALGIPMTYAETTQVQKYEVGQQFKLHTDYFEPGTSEYKNFAEERGNRTWTFMVYLNNVTEGGETYFSLLNHAFVPRQGQAVVWNNRLHNGDVNFQTLHAGMPVRKGEKYVITKWFREFPLGDTRR